jgi:hypothetical protein
VNQRLRDAELLGAVPEGDKAKVAEAILKTEVAVAQATESPLSSIASIVKWVAIGVAVFYAYEAFKKVRE